MTKHFTNGVISRSARPARPTAITPAVARTVRSSKNGGSAGHPSREKPSQRAWPFPDERGRGLAAPEMTARDRIGRRIRRIEGRLTFLRFATGDGGLPCRRSKVEAFPGIRGPEAGTVQHDTARFETPVNNTRNGGYHGE